MMRLTDSPSDIPKGEDGDVSTVSDNADSEELSTGVILRTFFGFNSPDSDEPYQPDEVTHANIEPTVTHTGSSMRPI